MRVVSTRSIWDKNGVGRGSEGLGGDTEFIKRNHAAKQTEVRHCIVGFISALTSHQIIFAKPYSEMFLISPAKVR